MQYTPQLKLYAHQNAALANLREKTSFALLMGMRTGKTAVIIAEFGEKLTENRIDNLLVVAPAGVYKTWLGELKKHMPKKVYQQIEVRIWQSGSELEPFTQKRSRVLLINVEALSSAAAGAQEACENFLLSGRTIMVVDESTTIKNIDSKRTEAALMLGPDAKFRRILSGLPTPRSPLDLFAQFWFLDPKILGFSSWNAFKARYEVTRKLRVGRRFVRVHASYKNIEELHGKIMQSSFRVRLQDCYDVPAKLYMTREVELTGEQKRLYAELKRYATAQLESGEHVTASEVIVQILRLHQICCGHVIDEEGNFHTVKSNRIKGLLEILDEYDGKAVIWCSYKHDVTAIAAALRKAYGDKTVACFWGGNRKDREAESKRFETDSECLYMIATPGSGGRGRTWSMAGLLIYYSNTDNLEHRDQSEERASGVGKEDRVTVIDLIARGTVEEKIVRSLRNKIDMSAVITGDSWREWVI